MEDGKILGPDDFLGVAELSGLLGEIDRWVVRQSIHLIAEHRQQGWEPCVAINVSSKAFDDPEMLPILRQELSATRVNPTSLLLELTETGAITSISAARKFVTSLDELGIRFALDDFGVGTSSFSILKELPADLLKIDGSFIRELVRSPIDQHPVRSMIAMAGGMNIKTVAELVDSEESLSMLRDYGADYAQGYYIGEPVEASEALPDQGRGIGRVA